jgi:hypothetical protein
MKRKITDHGVKMENATFKGSYGHGHPPVQFWADLNPPCLKSTIFIEPTYEEMSDAIGFFIESNGVDEVWREMNIGKHFHEKILKILKRDRERRING